MLVDDDTEVKKIELMGGDIIIRTEPIKGEIDNRVWRITSEGELIDSPSFFYE